MKKLLFAVLMAIGSISIANATVTDTFCGPASGMTCETQNDLMVYLQKQMDVTSGVGNIGGPSNSLPALDITSDGGALNMFIDLANGFATITPAHGSTTFNGLDLTTPGFGFTQLVFDEQLTPTSNPVDQFTITGSTGAHISVLPVGNESDAADTDKEFSITAVGGILDEVNIQSLTGFDEIKHLEVAGLCAIQSDGTCTPVVISTVEPGSVALMGVGLLGLAFVVNRKRAPGE
jgi:hypothetical protein